AAIPAPRSPGGSRQACRCLGSRPPVGSAPANDLRRGPLALWHARPAAGIAQSQACPPPRSRHPNGFRKPQRLWPFFRHPPPSTATSCHLVSQAPETTETGPKSRFQVQISRGDLLKKPLAGMDGNRTHLGRLSTAPQTVLKTAGGTSPRTSPGA